jgi:hypothetical protein
MHRLLEEVLPGERHVAGFEVHDAAARSLLRVGGRLVGNADKANAGFVLRLAEAREEKSR